ncbi:MAG: dihydroorotate dehydrogenase electron transfer subunit [Candidatus Eremiobacteraeota bacterium]|nr:dihydroorotate dehydrogenase electron transfer subunit [Candidatus Eremiobacteraeota bacterium]
MPTLASPAAVHSAVVVDRTELAAAVHAGLEQSVVLLGFDAPNLARVTRPGQFVMVVPPGGARAATALGVYEAEGNRASVMFFVCGSRTAELAMLRAGDRIEVVGPLGNGFDLSANPRNVAIVAGGVGIASVLLPAQALARSGAAVRLYYGARTAQLLVDKDKFADSGCELHCSTDDGSFGHRGFVTELLQQAEPRPDLILACGPSPMLRATAAVAAQLGVPAQLSLEETFACGVGGCWGCVVPIEAGSAQAPKFPGASAGGSDVVNARVCKEGPVFWAHELRW